MAFHYEDIFPVIGDLGPFQAVLVLISSLPVIVSAIQTYSPLFTLYTPRHRCRLPESAFSNDTYFPDGERPERDHMRVIEKWIPRSPDGAFKECCVFSSTDQNASARFCDAFVYDQSVVHSSATRDWDFVCSGRSMVTTSECIMWTGVMVGAVFFGIIADKFGRARAINVAVCANLTAGVILSLAPHPVVFVIFLFLRGSTLSGLLMSTFVLAAEHVGPSKRHLVSVVNHAFVAVGCFILALLSHLIKEWRVLELTATATCLPFLLYFDRNIIPESPRWLFAKHRMEELYAILEAAAKRNKIDLQLIYNLEGMNDASISIVQAQPTTGRLRDVFDLKRPNFLCKTLIVFLNWFVITMLFYGLTMQAGKVSSSLQLNLVISGSVELAAYTFCALTMMRWGRRQLLVLSHFLSGAALLATLCFPAKDDYGMDSMSSIQMSRLALVMIGKFGASVSFTIICIYSCEIFPTVVRSLGVGLSSCCGRLGGIMAPLIASVDQSMLPTDDACEDKGDTVDAKWSFMITGSLALVTGFLTILLPETLNEPLPETCDDAEENGLLPCFKVTRRSKSWKSRPSSSVGGQRPAADGEDGSLLIPPPTPLPTTPASPSSNLRSTSTWRTASAGGGGGSGGAGGDSDTTYGSIPALATNVAYARPAFGAPKDKAALRNHYYRLPSKSLMTHDSWLFSSSSSSNPAVAAAAAFNRRGGVS